MNFPAGPGRPQPPPGGVYSADQGVTACRANALLPPLSEAVTRGLQEQDPSGGRSLQVGLGRTLDQPLTIDGAGLSAGSWTAQADGTSTYAVSVVSAGALGLRLHLTNLKLPADTRLAAYDPANAQNTDLGGDAGNGSRLRRTLDRHVLH